VIILTPDQEKFIEDIRVEIRNGHKNILGVAPVAFGKTVAASYIMKNANMNGKTCWFVVHKRELVTQSVEAAQSFNIDVGIIASGKKLEPQRETQIVSIQSLASRIGKVKSPDIIIYDECHHSLAPLWQRYIKQFDGVIQIGLTGSPIYPNGRGLGELFTVMVKAPSMGELIQLGRLSPFKVYARELTSLDNISIKNGDYDLVEYAKQINPQILGDVVKEYQKNLSGKRAILFAPTIDMSETFAAQFNANGISAFHVDGTTPEQIRDKMMADFKSDKHKIMCNVGIAVEGFNCRAVEGVIITRPTTSLVFHIQSIGRALRTFEGKTIAIINDHCGNTLKHGLPDHDHQWTLEGLPKRSKKASEPSVKICEKCFTASDNFAKFCTNCGNPFAVKVRKGPENVDGDLVEVDKIALNKFRKKEQAMAKSLDDLIELGKKRNYKNAKFWAMNIMKSRKK
jgi:superfamily II DNA or RNA helicase